MRKKITLQAAPFQRIWNVMLDEAAYHYPWGFNVFFFWFSEIISMKIIQKSSKHQLSHLILMLLDALPPPHEQKFIWQR